MVMQIYVTCTSNVPHVKTLCHSKKKMILYQFLKGLKDTHAQERILEASAQTEGGELPLFHAMKLAESFEMSKKSSDIVNSSGQISKLSDHQKKKQTSRQESPNNNKKKSLRAVTVVRMIIHPN